MNQSDNPLLNQGHFLDFSTISPEHVTPAIGQLLEEAGVALSKAVSEQTPATFEAVEAPLQAATERLSRAWGAVHHLSAVVDSEQWRQAVNANLAAVTSFYVGLGQNLPLFAKYKAIAGSQDFVALDPLKRRVIEHSLRDFRLSGADLDEESKAKLKELEEELSTLSQKFSENLLDATRRYTLDVTDASELSGIPESILAAYRENARNAGIEGYRITLQYPDYLPALQYCDNRNVREQLARAFAVRASEFGPQEIDNSPVIARILENRYAAARLLGFANHAEESLATKMADTPAQVLAFLRDLNAKARPYAQRDNAELEAFARDELGLNTLEPWDRAYASEKLRQSRYSYSDEQVKQYFTLPAVFDGMFSLVGKLFGIRIVADKAPVWDENVQFWRIEDASGKTVAHFYTDLYARPTKRGGAWMDNDLTYCVMSNGQVRTPTAYLVCNFSRPVGGKPSLLRHDDVTTLFHEFGHGLHHLLSKVPVSELSGINGVEWDAVEMPSQFMENWCWDYEILRSLSKHVETGESLPRELFDRMLAARNFQSGLAFVRQLEFALFDMELHVRAPEEARDFMAVLREVQDEVCVFKPADYARFPQSFSHIFAGGYSAGYYSYKWAEVLSSDAFAAFEEEGFFSDAARRWRDEILAVGSSRDAIESFRAFRGREPRIDALLRHSGLTEPLG